jgi:hypothetical protein
MALHLLEQAVASLETVSIKEDFLGIASALLRVWLSGDVKAVTITQLNFHLFPP